MPKKLEEISATWCRERRKFTGSDGAVLIGEATDIDGKKVAIKTAEDGRDPQAGLTYRFYGSWQNYHNPYTGTNERQFHAKTFVKCQPHGKTGVIAYLGKAPKIGRVLAGRLYNKFGDKAVKVLREQPDVAAAAIDKLSLEAAQTAATWLDDEKDLEACTIDLIDLLDGRGFPKSVSKEIVKTYGNTAAQRIRANPYLLMSFRGCGFKRADALYLDLELPPAAIKRQALCAWHAIAARSTGDTWHFVEVVRKALLGSIGGTDVDAAAAMRLAVRGRILSVVFSETVNGPPVWDGSYLWVADARDAGQERRLAEYVAEAMNDQAIWPDIEPLREILTFEGEPHQFDILNQAIAGPLGILGGSPGTGKTFTAAQLIGAVIRLYEADQVGVAAPTGKAAVRLSEALADYQLPIRAKTLHSLLVVDTVDGGWSFKHNRANPLPYRVLVVDEASMLDTSLACSLFAARAKGTLLLLIGDTNQLPPVGNGAPLRDLIAAGVPYGELTKIRRNSGAIVAACAEIRQGRRFATYGEDLENGRNLVAVEHGDPLAALLELLHHCRGEGLDPVWECQTLCAVNKKSPLSRRELNHFLQNHLNANPAIDGSPFRLGDKVVNTKNGWLPIADEWQLEHELDMPGNTQPGACEEAQTNEEGDKVYVANGELAKIVAVEPKYFVATLSAPFRCVVIPRGPMSDGDDSDDESATGTGCNWDLAYALSVHKSQGSEWPVVIVMVDESPAAARVCSREWIYTAISRATRCCYLVGSDHVAQQFVKRTALDKRKTFLTALIHDEQRVLQRQLSLV